MNEMETTEETTPTISNLISSLEQSIQLAKQLQITSNPSHLLQIYSSLHSTNTHLSSFLNSHPIPPPSPAHAAENSQSDEPMEVGENEEVEEEKEAVIEKVEERFRDIFIQNKRPKRRRSPEREQRVCEYSGVVEFDPYETKMRALDLVYQFHA